VTANHDFTEAMAGATMVDHEFSDPAASFTKPPAHAQVTANHYFTDAMAGAAVVGISYFLAAHTPQFGRGAARDYGPTLYWITGPNSSIVLVAAAEPRDRESGDAEGLPLLSLVSGYFRESRVH